MNKRFFILRLMLLTLSGFFAANVTQAQFVNDNRIYNNDIASLNFYNAKQEQSFPLIQLKSNEKLILSFDDLQGGSKNYWYKIEHCTSDWKNSQLNNMDFVESFDNDRIIDYRYSSGTLQKYTHYRLELPNAQVQPKISGNYILKVYEDNDQSKPVLSQRFYILDSRMGIQAETTHSNQVQFRDEKQKVNFKLSPTWVLQNPQLDLKIWVMQNENANTAILNTKPSGIRGQELHYNDLNSNDFWALNSYRKFDTRSLRSFGQSVKEIVKTDHLKQVLLFKDPNRKGIPFSNSFDENGKFFIRNLDGRNADTDADYTDVFFNLDAGEVLANDEVYVVGRFNQYLLNSQNLMQYEPEKKSYYAKLRLKQGLYDYLYVLKRNNVLYFKHFEGSFVQTKNNYQILVYYKRPGARWEELVGFTNIPSMLGRR